MRKMLLLLVSLCVSLSLTAERIDRQTALKVAKTFSPESEFVELRGESQFANLYIFSDENSFVIVSADDRAVPILAYSDEFPFVEDKMPENISYWLTSLNEDIQYAIDNDLLATKEICSEWYDLKKGMKPARKNRAEVKPLVKTHWNQTAPYNNMCPDESATGCVATAMAQLMKYWEWPRKGLGYKSYSENDFGTLSADFANAVYDWDNMIDQPTISSPQAQQDAVAMLMYHCGVSVEMDYGPESGAYDIDVVEAFKNYFDYNSDLNAVSDYYVEDVREWKNLLKTELLAGRPMYYSGGNDVGGHAFICDGFDADDNFHFNWGWGGYCDGYYAIGALNPGVGGTGSGAGTYNEGDFIILGLYPNTPSVNPPTNVATEVEGNDVTISWSEPAMSSDESLSYKVYRDGCVVGNNIVGNSFTDKDLPYGIHEYRVRTVNSDGDYSLMSSPVEVEIVFAGPVPTNLTAKQQDGDNVVLSWTVPASESAELKYGDGQHCGSAYGSGVEGTDYYWGQRYTSEQLSQYAGMAITSVQTFLYKEAAYELIIYSEVDGELKQQLSKSFVNEGNVGWVTVSLDAPLVIDYRNDMVIAIRNNTVAFPAVYVDNYDGGDNASLYSGDGSNYMAIGGISWLIKTNISDGEYTYNVYRDGEQIASDIAQNTYTDKNLVHKAYEYTVKTNYNGMLSASSEPASIIVRDVNEYNVVLSVNPADAGVVTGAGLYYDESSVTVSATPNVGYLFQNWTENETQVSADASYTFVISNDCDLVANFVKNDLSIEISDVEDASCNGCSDGSVVVLAKGGVSPYIYKLNDEISDAVAEAYTFKNLGAGKYTIEVSDATGYSVTTTVNVAEPDLGTPENLEAKALSTSEIKLTWDEVKGATEYYIYKDSKRIDIVEETEYIVEDLDPGTEYCFEVKAVNDEEESEKSEEDCATTLGESLEEMSSSINFYPNPVEDKLYIETEVEIEDVVVYDVYGRQQTTVNGQQSLSIDVAELNSGVYFVKVVTSEGEIVKRFIKK